MDKRTRVVFTELFGAQQELRREIEASVHQAINCRLIGFGLDEGDRKELQADLQYVRAARKRAEEVHGLVVKGLVTGIFTSLVGAVWLGLKTAIGR